MKSNYAQLISNCQRSINDNDLQCVVKMRIIKKHKKLLSGGVWCIIKIGYLYDEGEEFIDGNSKWDLGEDYIDISNSQYDFGEEFLEM